MFERFLLVQGFLVGGVGGGLIIIFPQYAGWFLIGIGVLGTLIVLFFRRSEDEKARKRLEFLSQREHEIRMQQMQLEEFAEEQLKRIGKAQVELDERRMEECQ